MPVPSYLQRLVKSTSAARWVRIPSAKVSIEQDMYAKEDLMSSSNDARLGIVIAMHFSHRHCRVQALALPSAASQTCVVVRQTEHFNLTALATSLSGSLPGLK